MQKRNKMRMELAVVKKEQKVKDLREAKKKRKKKRRRIRKRRRRRKREVSEILSSKKCLL
jgi:hypothetical protein